MYIKNVNIVHWLHEGEGDMKIWDMKIYPPKKICISRRYHLREISNTLSSHKSWLLIFFFLVDGGGGLNFIFPNSYDNIYLFTHQIVGQNKLIRWLEKRGELPPSFLSRYCT